MVEQTSLELGGRKLTFETGKMAKQAHGAIVARYGDTVVLATACMDTHATEKDFLPLTVDYREYTYAAGKIPGGFFKREGRPSERETLTSRLIDRPLRPLFPEGYATETQVVAMVLSADSENDPDVIGVTAASAALYISKIPFNNPIAAVRVGLIDGKLIINPTVAEQKTSLMNIVIAGSEQAIVMVEAGSLEVSEDIVADALEFGHNAIKTVIAAIKELGAKVGQPKMEVKPPAFDESLYKAVSAKYTERMRDALDTAKHPKLESYGLVDQIKAEILAEAPAEDEEKQKLATRAFERLRERIFRDDMLVRRRRPDARAFDQIRQITCEIGVLPRVHGSALFTRGETQALVTTTLGTKEDKQRLDLLFEEESFKRFMLHYNFPAFSVGEVKFLRGPGRREIGHGALAERALANLVPPETDFPYAMRVVSDIMESNGSSSMASVCGGSLSLMDAGVPLKSPCAGIAMGLVIEDDKYAILTDIAGAEDHYGDMDFKVAGTRQGITALQMDIKVTGVTIPIMREALEQARKARFEILDIMAGTITTARAEISTYAPHLHMLTIPTDKIRDLIGPGGKKIRSIIEATGVKIDVMDDGKVHVFANNGTAAEAALKMIRDVTATAEIGKTYLGTVVRIADFGAFVELFPGTDGLLHISEIAEARIRSVRDELKEGDQILVKVLAIEGNKIRLSRKAVLRDQRDKQQQKSEAAG
ncbi:MAG TPA: polyribonucleotide nucleotidyltransferase [Candidatus Binatia bacterium]|jgi:polyribonucleotide nucleotidyltransferase|nr:polyribonucleotide nucleotidyltransferase [Candidatus Binatia bacterium]